MKNKTQNKRKPARKKQAVSRLASRRSAKQKRQQQERTIRMVLVGICMLALGILIRSLVQVYIDGRQARAMANIQEEEPITVTEEVTKVTRPQLDVELLPINEYSRPGIALDQVKGVVIHYTANPGTGAIANRNYFEGLMNSHVTKASSHFIIGLEGEIVQCIPCSEISYASNERNSDTISIECCIEGEDGRFNQATYAEAVHLTAWLVERYHLKVSDVIRHYDVTGKLCPKYYVEHPDAWEQFLQDVQYYLAKAGVKLEEE